MVRAAAREKANPTWQRTSSAMTQPKSIAKKVLTTEQLRDLKDNMYRKKVLTTKQLHDLKDRIQHDKIQDV